jgi:hypothetical protein
LSNIWMFYGIQNITGGGLFWKNWFKRKIKFKIF